VVEIVSAKATRADAVEIMSPCSPKKVQNHANRICSEQYLVVSSPANEVSDNSFLGLQDVEPDDNKCTQLDTEERLICKQSVGVNDDVNLLGRTNNCVETSSEATLAQDANTCRQSLINDIAEQRAILDNERACRTKSVEVMVENSVRTSSVLENESSMHSVHLPQQPNQSSVDRRCLGSRRSSAHESSGEQSVQSQDVAVHERGIACEFSIPEIPVFQKHPTSVDRLPASLWPEEDSGANEINRDTDASSSEVAETAATGVTFSNEAGPEFQSALAGEEAASEITCGDVSAGRSTSGENSTDVDVCSPSSGDPAFAYEIYSNYGRPLDLTCGRARSPFDAAESSTVTVPRFNSTPHTNCVHMCHYRHTASTYCAVSSCSLGWPVHPYTCSRRNSGPSPYPHCPGPCCGTNPLPPATRSRGTRSRRRPPRYSCSRVDGIRSTKILASDERPETQPNITLKFSRSRMKDIDSCSSGGSLGPEMYSSSGRGTAPFIPASTSSADAAVSDHQIIHDFADVSVNKNATVNDVNNACVSPRTASRTRGGPRRGRTPRKPATGRSRSSVKESDGGNQSAVRGRPRGRPRKHQGNVTAGHVDPPADQVEGLLPIGDGRSSSGKVDAVTAPLRRGRGQPRNRRSRLTASSRSFLGRKSCRSVAEHCDTGDFENAAATPTAQAMVAQPDVHRLAAHAQLSDINELVECIELFSYLFIFHNK